MQLKTHVCLLAMLLWTSFAFGDGKVVPPRDYKGSLEEKSQEAIIIFHGGTEQSEAVEDLILRIHVTGEAERFAWIIPLPNKPKIAEEDAGLFQELFEYVDARQRRGKKFAGSEFDGLAAPPEARAAKVEVLSREVIADYEVTVVRETVEGGLNPWLEAEGYQRLENAEDVIGFYREKSYVFVCIKLTSEALANEGEIDSPPLRFTFKTGGRDGIFFPMKLTGLQSEPFDVNLYVFYQAWLNDQLNSFGYRHRGFSLRHRDWDTSECVANGGKAYSLPEEDPYLQSLANKLPKTKALMQKLHPGAKYYLTNIQAYGLKPTDVRAWADDLWLFPYYTNRKMMPYDARPGGPASAAYIQDDEATLPSSSRMNTSAPIASSPESNNWFWLGLAIAIAGILPVVGIFLLRWFGIAIPALGLGTQPAE